MNDTPGKLQVLVGKKFGCIKISGRANFTSSVDFKSVFNELLREGYNYFVLELSECTLMDSTFLGVLAGFGLKLNPGDGDHCVSGIELLNPNPRITELLESLGMLHLFRVVEGPLKVSEDTEIRALSPANPSKNEITRACLEAHQTLMDLNAANVPKFKDVTQFLTEKLKNGRGG